MNFARHAAIRPATSLEEATTLWWPLMTSLGWNRSFHDLESYISASCSRGLFVAVPEGSSEPVGHVMATIYDNSTGWVTLFVVQPDHQRKGYGKALFSAALQEFKNHDTSFVGLDAVVQQKATYERRGFVESPLGRVRCMSWSIQEAGHATSPEQSGLQTVDIKDVPREFLVGSDYKHTGFERKGLWNEKFLNRSDLFGLALIDGSAVSKYEDIRAWTVVRRVPQGYRMGPVYAADSQSARCIINAAMKHAVRETKNASSGTAELHPRGAEARTITAEIWDGNPNAVGLFEELRWTSLGVEYHRMWLHGKATPQQAEGGLAHSGMYAIFDAAIG